MSKKLENWKKNTATQVKLTGCISAATGLEMMEYISNLESALIKIRDLDYSRAAINMSALDAMTTAGKALDT